MKSFLPPANEVWGKVIFSVACVKNSVHSWGSIWAGTPSGRYTTPGQVHPPAGTPPSRYTLGQVHPPGRYTPLGAVHARRYGQQADGTHPTGMHSSYDLFLRRAWPPRALLSMENEGNSPYISTDLETNNELHLVTLQAVQLRCSPPDGSTVTLHIHHLDVPGWGAGH